jgi:hypothetical protein
MNENPEQPHAPVGVASMWREDEIGGALSITCREKQTPLSNAWRQ